MQYNMMLVVPFKIHTIICQGQGYKQAIIIQTSVISMITTVLSAAVAAHAPRAWVVLLLGVGRGLN